MFRLFRNIFSDGSSDKLIDNDETQHSRLTESIAQFFDSISELSSLEEMHDYSLTPLPFALSQDGNRFDIVFLKSFCCVLVKKKHILLILGILSLCTFLRRSHATRIDLSSTKAIVIFVKYNIYLLMVEKSEMC